MGEEIRQEYCTIGCCARRRLFQRIIPCQQKPNYMGGNYFALPPTRCFVIWRKLTISESFSMAMAEYAWTSFNENAKIFEYPPQAGKEGRFHPTQKPVALYEWLIGKYAKDGDIILDTHVGSGSSLVACRNTNHKYVGFEINEGYYAKAKERIEANQAQMTFFDFAEMAADKGETEWTNN